MIIEDDALQQVIIEEPSLVTCFRGLLHILGIMAQAGKTTKILQKWQVTKILMRLYRVSLHDVLFSLLFIAQAHTNL